MIEITNKGEIPIEAFTLLGASDKKGVSGKIGYFGSGLKYAIAKLMRDNVRLNIFSGLKEIKITTSKVFLKSKEFDVINIDNHATSITTELGPSWETWQAIREIFCNAVDESEYSIKNVLSFEPQQNYTKIYIDENSEVQKVLNNWDHYFCTNRNDQIVKNDDWEVYHGHDIANIYRKGIRCFDSKKKSVYDYNFNEIEINESRVIAYGFQLYEKLAHCWSKYATIEMINNLFSSINNFQLLEYEIDWDDWSAKDFNDNWIKTIGDKILVPYEYAGSFQDELERMACLILPNRLIRNLIKCFGEKIRTVIKEFSGTDDYQILDFNKKQKFLLDETLTFFDEVGLLITNEIKIVAFSDPNVLGKAINENILLSFKLFDMGRKQIACTLLEEVFHIESSANDKTRQFQDYIINKIITILENKNGMFL